MSKSHSRFVAETESGMGWRIWDKQQKKWWGERYQNYPEELLAELNKDKNPERLAQLLKQTRRQMF